MMRAIAVHEVYDDLLDAVGRMRREPPMKTFVVGAPSPSDGTTISARLKGRRVTYRNN